MGKRRTVVCFGPGPVFKGGLSNYNTSLAKALDRIDDVEVYIVSWTQQYPSIIPREFKDLSSKRDLLKGTNIKCKYITNYNNPLSWRKTAGYIAGLKPETVIFQWSISLQGLPVGRIINRLKRISKCEIIIDLHFVVQKERSKIDRILTRIGISKPDTYIIHALKTFHELKELLPHRQFHLSENGFRANQDTVIKLYHPVYDLFKPDPDFDVDAFKKKHNLKKYVFLFFGFIRKYKGLHHAIHAFKLVVKQRSDVSLLVCGESFWDTLDKRSFRAKLKNLTFGLAKRLFLGDTEDERDYRPLDLIDKFGLQDNVVVINRFIPNEEVHQYFQASNCTVLYYLTATPSGIESLSYNFNLPILATKVGHFPETVQDGINGYLAEADNIESMAEQMIRFLDHPISPDNVRKSAADLSWDRYAMTILNK